MYQQVELQLSTEALRKILRQCALTPEVVARERRARGVLVNATSIGFAKINEPVASGRGLASARNLQSSAHAINRKHE